MFAFAANSLGASTSGSANDLLSLNGDDDAIEGSKMLSSQYKSVAAAHGEDSAKLLLQCCALDCEERPSFDQVRGSSW